MLQRALAVLTIVVGVMWLPAAANAQTSIPPSNGPFVISPISGPAGTTISGSQQFDPSFSKACSQWYFVFGGTLQSGEDTNAGSSLRQSTVQVPTDAVPGHYQVVSFCAGGRLGTRLMGSADFEVLGPPTTTTSTTTTTIPTTTTATTTTTIPTTTTAKATTTTAKATTTTAKATTTTAKSSTTTIATTTTTTTSTTTTLPTTTTAPTTTIPAEERDLTLDKPSVSPGGDVVATGQGCDAGATVTLEIEGEQVGKTTAAEDGTFSTPIAVPDVDPGRLEVIARCGPLLTTQLDVVLASSVTGGQSILLVIAICVIVLFALLWYGLQARRG